MAADFEKGGGSLGYCYWLNNHFASFSRLYLMKLSKMHQKCIRDPVMGE